MHITLTGRITEKQYKQIALRLFFSNAIQFGLLVLGIMLCVFALILRVNDNSPLVYHLFEVIGIYFLAIRPFWYYKRLGKAYHSSKSAGKEVTYVFTDDKLMVKGEGFEKHINWSYFYFILNRKGTIAIYENIYTGHMLLKHWFTPAQMQEFAAFVKTLEGVKKSGF